MSTSCLLDLSSRAKVRLLGSDRVRFLNGQVSNDIRRLNPGASLYACLMTAKGKMSADVFISASPGAESPGYLRLDAEAILHDALIGRLERYLVADDVTIEDDTETVGLFHLLGPAAANLPSQAGIHQVGSQRFGQTGIDLFFDMSRAEELRSRLRENSLFTELGPNAIEGLRINAGIPAWGTELDENTIPIEAGLETRAIDYHKGCYVGQEVISRLKSVGHVNRHLRRIIAHGLGALTAGMILHPLDSAGASARKELGRLTSAAPAPPDETGAQGGFVALAYVRRGWEAPGTRLLASDPMNAGSLMEVQVAEC